MKKTTFIIFSLKLKFKNFLIYFSNKYQADSDPSQDETGNCRFFNTGDCICQKTAIYNITITDTLLLQLRVT